MIPIFRDWLNRNFSDPQIVILGFLIFLGFVFIFFLGDMLLPVFASIVIAYILDGMVEGLQRWKVPRMAAMLIVFTIFMASLLLSIVGLLPLLSRQIAQLVQQLPSMVADGQAELLKLPERYPDFVSEPQIRRILDFIGTGFMNLVQRILTYSIASVRGFIALLVYLVLVPLLVFFFLKDKEKIIVWISSLLPGNRGLATEVWREVNQQIGNYIRGKIWEVLIIWSASYITFTFIGLKFSVLLSLFVGLSVLVPYVGVTVIFLPVMLIAYFQWGFGADLVYTVIAYAVIQLLDGNLLAPLLLSEVVDLHPVAIIVAVLLFGGLWGVWGLFFAIPLATLVHAVLKAWLGQNRLSDQVETT